MPAQNSTAPINTQVSIPSSSGNGTYLITKHANGSWSCTCGAWKNQRNLDSMRRRCKHMDQLVNDLGGHVVGAYRAAEAVAEAAAG